MQLRNVNLNHLVALRELLRTRNVTRAANNLGLTQSTVSGILTQLRATFEDELLVVSGRAMFPTERAEQLLEPLEEILEKTATLYEPTAFDPLVAEGAFILGTGLVTLVPQVISRLAEDAPGVRLIALSPDASSLRRLRSGEMDVLIAPPGRDEGKDICQAYLHSDKLVCIAAADNANVPEVLDLDTYRSLGLAAYWPGADHPDVSQRLIAHELPERNRPAVRVSSLALLPFVVATSPYVSVVPSRLAKMFVPLTSMRIVETSFDLPTFVLNMYWTKRTDRSPLHAFVRSVVSDIGRSIDGDQPTNRSR